MKKIILFLLAALLISVNCFAQSQSQQTSALQGTWTLVAFLNDESSYTEQELKAENFVASYTFSGNYVTINNSSMIIGPVRFEPEGGYLKLIGENVVYLPYSLQENILILHEGNFAFIYRKDK